MIRREFLNGKVTLYAGDCIDVLAGLPTKRAAVAKTKNKLMGAEGTPLFPEPKQEALL